MAKKMKLNHEVDLDSKIYKVIGIDHYVLTNLFGGTREWDSYTLIDAKNNKTWISQGAVKDYYLHWILVSESEFKKMTGVAPNLNLTGIADVTFQGNPGYSTPTAELVWFDLQNAKYDFMVYERFLEPKGKKVKPQEPYYDAGRILKNFTI